ncbi:MAG: RNA polymerase sigma factor [Rhodothermales bacterium]
MGVENTVLPDLFRTEYSKLVAVLCRTFGLSNIQIAEDIVSDTFLLASETWGKKGIPDNQAGWLYTVAKNRARDYVRREVVRLEKVEPYVKSIQEKTEIPEVDLSIDNIRDSQLRMIFAVCHPILDKKSQIILALRVLCGFAVNEIASALLITKDTVNKRLYRAKKNLRDNQVEMVFPPAQELPRRLQTVLKTLYLLFNEGYYSSSDQATVRKELCLEAMRLTLLLAHNEHVKTPEADALLALMCFHASRFEARNTEHADIVLYADQDRDLWETGLIQQGEHYMNRAATGMKLSIYHLEAAIAYWHTQEEGNEKWENILQLYNQLLQISYAPMAALNRTYALAKARSVKEGLAEALNLALDDNHLYHCLLAELYEGASHSRDHLIRALELCTTPHEKALIQKKIADLT